MQSLVSEDVEYFIDVILYCSGVSDPGEGKSLGELHSLASKEVVQCRIGFDWIWRQGFVNAVLVTELEELFLSGKVSFLGFVPLDLATKPAIAYPR